MFKRIKNLWKLSEKEIRLIKPNEAYPSNSVQVRAIVEEGDGKAEFIGSGTEEEFIEQQRKDNGLDKWYKRIGL